ncbi:MAG: PDZ domain-containing protein, partial [Clostridia bacterium]|nr:PDZ domain-containing protein [Clostridia bacterium]
MDAVTATLDLIRREYAGDVNEEALIQGALRGMVEALGDPYSYYLSPEEYQSFQDDLEGHVAGVGVVIERQEEGITVVSVLPNTPAERAGLQPGDRLEAVDGRELSGLTAEEAARLIRGPVGSRVVLQVRRGDAPPFTVTVERAEFDVPSVESRLLADNLAYVRITQFQQNTAAQFRAAYGDLLARGARGVVLDLRNNPGGYLEPAVEVAQHLVPRGTIVQIVAADGSKTVVQTKPHAPGPPLVAIVNEGTASAAEILAAALKENGVAVLVGTKTFGKGLIQTVFDLGDVGAVRLTTARYLTPKGNEIQGRGLAPDREVPVPASSTPSFAPLGTRPLAGRVVGLDVLGVQQRLRFLGFDPGPEDGVLGSRTLAAFRAFAAARGLAAGDRIEPEAAAAL